MITRALLRSLRNDLPMPFTIQQLGARAPSSKCAEGHFRFVCHHCGEFLATVNPRNNLAHCFNCGKDINNIDLLLASGYGFLEAVETLQIWLLVYERVAPIRTQPITNPKNRPNPTGALRLAQILRQEFGNDGPAPSTGSTCSPQAGSGPAA